MVAGSDWLRLDFQLEQINETLLKDVCQQEVRLMGQLENFE